MFLKKKNRNHNQQCNVNLIHQTHSLFLLFQNKIISVFDVLMPYPFNYNVLYNILISLFCKVKLVNVW